MPYLKELKQLSQEEIRKIFFEQNSWQEIEEPVYSLGKGKKATKIPPLVEVEIALRKCKRSGVFRK